MLPEDFAKIESSLGLKLPEWYVNHLRVYPFSESDYHLFDSAEWTIRQNERLRADGYFGAPWPYEFFAIGESGSGDPFFIRLGKTYERIFWADHECGPVPAESNLAEMEFAPTLDAYIAQHKELMIEIAQQVERRRSKKWWQFWV